jgi:hypothetical protein
MSTKPVVTIETVGPTLMGAKIIGPSGGQIDCSRLTFQGDVNEPNCATIEIPLAGLRTQAEADFIVTQIDGKRYRLVEDTPQLTPRQAVEETHTGFRQNMP